MEPLQEMIKEIVAECATFVLRKTALENEKTEFNQRIIDSLIPLCKERLQGWIPKVGDSLVNIHFDDQICYELIVISVSGLMVRAKEGDRNCVHNIDLGDEASDYEVPVIVIPVSLYLEFKPYLPFQVLPTPILVGEYLKQMMPMWAI